VTTESYYELTLGDLLEGLSADGRAPGAGAAAGITVAFAASLVAMAARCSTGAWREAAGIASQALAIRTRALELAYEDAEAWQRALAALASAQGGSDERRDFALQRELERAAVLPLAIADLGADAAALAAETAERCDGTYRADVAAAAALAAGSAQAAAHLVEVNLAVREGDPLLIEARRSAEVAREAADRVLVPTR
jgi:formiminotetrahydrofolate cyclodeaminase